MCCSSMKPQMQQGEGMEGALLVGAGEGGSSELLKPLRQNQALNATVAILDMA